MCLAQACNQRGIGARRPVCSGNHQLLAAAQWQGKRNRDAYDALAGMQDMLAIIEILPEVLFESIGQVDEQAVLAQMDCVDLLKRRVVR
ncbi:MAG: hypothetical protein R3E02_15955 [Blastomonas sp.]